MRSWLQRQSFLGPNSDSVLTTTKIALVGLGGGNSHTGQQAAHVGIGNYLLIDPDTKDDTNRNRLIGGTPQDALDARPKVDIAERTIRSILPTANIIKKQAKWQDVSEFLKTCDVVVGGLDSVRGKDELEHFCRRFLIPYIDMGMDVHEVGTNFLVSGQVILSSPGTPCLRCFGIVTDEALRQEGQRYGAAGSRPQVVWPNGVLASSAVGLLMQLLTPWHDCPVDSAYLEYDGNLNTVKVSEKFKVFKNHVCPHHPLHEVGDPVFDIRRPYLPLLGMKDVPVQKTPLSWWKRLLIPATYSARM